MNSNNMNQRKNPTPNPNLTPLTNKNNPNKNIILNIDATPNIATFIIAGSVIMRTKDNIIPAKIEKIVNKINLNNIGIGTKPITSMIMNCITAIKRIV